MSDPTTFSYQVLDDQGLTNTVTMYVAYDGLTETQDGLVNGWLAYGDLISACLDGAIVGGAITIPCLPGTGGNWKATPANGNNVNQVINENFKNGFNSYVTEILLPAYSESILTNKVPNIGSGALKALNDAIVAGTPPVTPAIFPNSKDLNALTALKDAFLTTRKVRHQRTKTRVTP